MALLDSGFRRDKGRKVCWSNRQRSATLIERVHFKAILRVYGYGIQRIRSGNFAHPSTGDVSRLPAAKVFSFTAGTTLRLPCAGSIVFSAFFCNSDRRVWFLLLKMVWFFGAVFTSISHFFFSGMFLLDCTHTRIFSLSVLPGECRALILRWVRTLRSNRVPFFEKMGFNFLHSSLLLI